MELKISRRIIRRKKRVGMFMAFSDDQGKIGVGYCLCSRGDKYSHDLAYKICKSRACSAKNEIAVPESLVKDYDDFIIQCEKYFRVEFDK